jgi:coenzyme Q-binding protein COQ10
MPRHAETRIVPYSSEQMFDLVADVARYPEFLPWCVGARVTDRTDAGLIGHMTIGFGPFRESFVSRVGFDRPGRISVKYERGPFKYLNNVWEFSADPGGCKIGFSVDFEFRNALLRAAIGVVFHEATRRMVNAFLIRARAIYGKETAIASQRVDVVTADASIRGAGP